MNLKNNDSTDGKQLLTQSGSKAEFFGEIPKLFDNLFRKHKKPDPPAPPPPPPPAPAIIKRRNEKE